MEIKSTNHKIPIQQKREVDSTQYIPEPYKKVAKGMESQFAQFMFEQMQKTVHSEKPESSADKYYKSLLSQHRADKLSDRGGLGIQKMILNQIYPTRLRNKMTYEAYKNQMALNPQKPQIKMVTPKNEVVIKEKESL
jgi:Rod binding domain-containing protein